jgi:hypothetical protein
MRERGISTLPAVLLAGLAGLVAATLLVDWVIVDVQTPEPEGIHLKIPFPLIVADIATEFIPEEAMEETEVPPELRAQKDAILGGLEALLDAPDAVLVEVQAEDAHVFVAKEGDNLRISVDADDAVVRCTVPLDGVFEALQDWDWQTFDPDLVFDVLSEAGNGNLVTVEADGARVAVNLW